MTGSRRLVTKCDIDGLASGILLQELGLVDSALFCHPRDIETGAVQITGTDITAGLPGRGCAHLAFDHYPGAVAAHGTIVDTGMRSTSRVIYNHFGQARFNRSWSELLHVADKVSSADVTQDDILYPTGWMLLSHLIDHRTGLDRYARFALSCAELLEMLMVVCRERTVWDALSLPQVEERSACYFDCADAYKSQILHCATVRKNLLVVDLRNEDTVYPGNRFMIDALFPECNASLLLMRSRSGNGTLFVAGKSFLDRSLNIDIGSVMRESGGNGHPNAGTCDVDNDRADAVARKLITALKYGFFKNLFMGYHNYYYQ